MSSFQNDAVDASGDLPTLTSSLKRNKERYEMHPADINICTSSILFFNLNSFYLIFATLAKTLQEQKQCGAEPATVRRAMEAAAQPAAQRATQPAAQRATQPAEDSGCGSSSAAVAF